MHIRFRVVRVLQGEIAFRAALNDATTYTWLASVTFVLELFFPRQPSGIGRHIVRPSDASRRVRWQWQTVALNEYILRRPRTKVAAGPVMDNDYSSAPNSIALKGEKASLFTLPRTISIWLVPLHTVASFFFDRLETR